MKKFFLTAVLLASQIAAIYAQDSTIFYRTIYNDEYDIYLKMNFYQHNIIVPGQDFMGEMYGYLGDNQDGRKWFILDVNMINENTAQLEISNDEGSEDLTATLTYNPAKETYTLKQGAGSTVKIARNRKWKKLSKTIVYTKAKNPQKQK